MNNRVRTGNRRWRAFVNLMVVPMILAHRQESLFNKRYSAGCGIVTGGRQNEGIRLAPEKQIFRSVAGKEQKQL